MKDFFYNKFFIIYFAIFSLNNIIVAFADSDKTSSNALVIRDVKTDSELELSLAIVEGKEEPKQEEVKASIPVYAPDLRRIVKDILGLKADKEIKINQLDKVEDFSFNPHGTFDKADIHVTNHRNGQIWWETVGVKIDYDNAKVLIDEKYVSLSEYNKDIKEKSKLMLADSTDSIDKDSGALQLYENPKNKNSNALSVPFFEPGKEELIIRDNIKKFIEDNVNEPLAEEMSDKITETLKRKAERRGETAEEFKVTVNKMKVPSDLLERLDFDVESFGFGCTAPTEITGAYKISEIDNSLGKGMTVVIAGLAKYPEGTALEKMCKKGDFKTNNGNQQNTVYVLDFYEYSNIIRYIDVNVGQENSHDSYKEEL